MAKYSSGGPVDDPLELVVRTLSRGGRFDAHRVRLRFVRMGCGPTGGATECSRRLPAGIRRRRARGGERGRQSWPRPATLHLVSEPTAPAPASAGSRGPRSPCVAAATPGRAPLGPRVRSADSQWRLDALTARRIRSGLRAVIIRCIDAGGAIAPWSSTRPTSWRHHHPDRCSLPASPKVAHAQCSSFTAFGRWRWPERGCSPGRIQPRSRRRRRESRRRLAFDRLGGVLRPRAAPGPPWPFGCIRLSPPPSPAPLASPASRCWGRGTWCARLVDRPAAIAIAAAKKPVPATG